MTFIYTCRDRVTIIIAVQNPPDIHIIQGRRSRGGGGGGGGRVGKRPQNAKSGGGVVPPSVRAPKLHA